MVIFDLHASALLRNKHAEREEQPISISRLQKFPLLEALCCPILFFETNLDLVEFGFDLRTWGRC